MTAKLPLKKHRGRSCDGDDIRLNVIFYQSKYTELKLNGCILKCSSKRQMW